ncbi:DUF5017 domain-containing protein [Proteiniphilum sp. UBA5384]|uniref:DUF5017 domain-containing protein n=1 Tax=Proteiniphilum sp. UBA5384 TaxID=1947279 RepID=UPI0025EE346D|nr:DUF5017 domain-containing protein [Proteiniphilum sp. UBA5384]
MKTSRFLIGIAVLFLLSCIKEGVDTPTFDLPVKDLEVTAGKTVQFDFTGDANYITFYSGEPGKIYEYRDRIQKELEGTVTLSFSTRIMNGYELPRELDVLISTDYNGSNEYEDVSNATWIDISDRFEFPIVNTGALTPAGIIDVSDLLVPGKPFFVAFRYTSIGVPPGPRMNRQWRVELFELINEYSTGTTILANHQTAGWSIVSRGGVEEGRGGSIQSNRLNFFANIGESIDVGLEEWGITQEIDLFKVAPDTGLAIKNMSENRMESYSHIYETPGVYKAVFEASNTNIYGHKSIAKEINITVN